MNDQQQYEVEGTITLQVTVKRTVSADSAEAAAAKAYDAELEESSNYAHSFKQFIDTANVTVN